MKIVLICHKDSVLSYRGIATWLNAFSDLAGIVVIEERKQKKMERVKKEMKRSGFWGLIDVLLFRFFYKFTGQSKDRLIEQSILDDVKTKYGEPDFNQIDKVTVTTPNAKAAQAFIESKQPDFIIARCKFLLTERIFSIPKFGTYVFHPGICPEYRNAHGCFWAIMNKDYDNVGMTMLKIDKGVDTGPIYGYFTYDYDPVGESHVTIQSRVVFDNLEGIKDKINEIYQGTAVPLTVDKSRKSNVWGQPRLTKFLRWKWQRKRE
ncbi:formyltransferase family protein [Fulvivirgaceae bacterium BMA12]|uniref:Formyltransferase family protein n=1 Tax=Agaribacillus aureus TaxID=3051825 RepID=A0ABT8L1M4_9BACT|nr:formyltransferase family protein [Fulvivirgaceae bacterium BMA12]